MASLSTWFVVEPAISMSASPMYLNMCWRHLNHSFHITHNNFVTVFICLFIGTGDKKEKKIQRFLGQHGSFWVIYRYDIIKK